MKRYILSPLIVLLVLLPVILLQSACEDNDVDLPRPMISLDKSVIIAPASEVNFSLAITANCNWEVSIEGGDESWIVITPDKATGNQDAVIKLTTNGDNDRNAVIKITSLTDSRMFKTVEVKQYANTNSGYMPISDLRLLANNLTSTLNTYDITDDWKIRGIITTDINNSNFPESTFAIQDGRDENCGIAIRTKEILWHQSGEEVMIDLKGAKLTKDINDVLEIHPVSDDKVTRTETTTAHVAPVEISYAELITGKYESMYVGIPSVQLIAGELSEMMEGGRTMQNADDERFIMYTYPTASFSTDKVPSGSGRLAGVASKINGNYAVLPCSRSDFNLDGQRIGIAVGIKLPYVFSFLAVGPGNNDGMVYTTRTGVDTEPAGQKVFPNDGSGVMLTFHNLTGAPNQLRVTYWIEQSGHHNLPMKSWQNTDAHARFEIPLAEDIRGKFRFSFGMGSTNGGPRNWKVTYSTDNNQWFDCDAGTNLSQPLNSPVGSQKNFFYYSAYITPNTTLLKGSTLYIKLGIADNGSVNGGTVSNGGESRLHSAVIIDKAPTKVSEFPSGAVYTEGFDRIFGGLDYLLGDKLSAMVAYSGADITEWNETQKAGLSGSFVRERTGYVQIGFADTQILAPSALVNNVGSLITPKLSALTQTTNVKLTFKAMAYKTMAIATNAKDLKGDITKVKVEVLGGGTINGSTSSIVEGLNHSSFTTLTVDIDNATPDTQIKFTSDPGSGEYSRWFLDDICVQKR